MFPDQQR